MKLSLTIHFQFQSFNKEQKYIHEINEKGKCVLVTGGTGLYLNSLIYNMDFAQSDANNELREELQKQLAEKGIDYMHNKLKRT